MDVAVALAQDMITKAHLGPLRVIIQGERLYMPLGSEARAEVMDRSLGSEARAEGMDRE